MNGEDLGFPGIKFGVCKVCKMAIKAMQKMLNKDSTKEQVV